MTEQPKEDVYAVLWKGGAAMTTEEVAEKAGINRRAARFHLRALEETGRVESGDIGERTAWAAVRSDADGPDEHPCHLCGEWFPATDLVAYTRRPRNDPDDDRVPVPETLVYCPECDRTIQNQGRDAMIQAGIDPGQNKERFHDGAQDEQDAQDERDGENA